MDDHLVGMIRTRSSNNPVTDSAAAGTAYATGQKTYNGMLSISPQGEILGTLLESAQLKGLMTGLVVTNRISDATPAAFYAHSDNRRLENNIIDQLLAQGMIDVVFGGGRQNFLPEGIDGGVRTDGKNLLEGAQKLGYQVIRHRRNYSNL